ncbi:hypothetical protein GCM10028808_63330 [Spirosoma migulaei]
MLKQKEYDNAGEKQKLVKKMQMVPENYYDDLNQLLDTILASEKQRNEKFDELLAKTSIKYKAVWEAFA